MCPHQSEKILTSAAEKLYLDLLYCRADARNCEIPYVAHLLNLACEEMQKLADAETRAVDVQPDWNAFHMYPGMK